MAAAMSTAATMETAPAYTAAETAACYTAANVCTTAVITTTAVVASRIPASAPVAAVKRKRRTPIVGMLPFCEVLSTQILPPIRSRLFSTGSRLERRRF